jgi:hypothetical protein
MSPPCPETSLNFERIFIMKSNLIATAVVAVAALTSVAASAQTFNSYLFDQMSAPTAKTRAEVKSEIQSGVASASSFNGANAQRALPAAPAAEKTVGTVQAGELPKSNQQ